MDKMIKVMLALADEDTKDMTHEQRQGKRRRCFSAVRWTDVLAVFEKSALVGRQWTENE